jgi:folate-binding protein YgfZ
LDLEDMGGDDNQRMDDSTATAPEFDGALHLADWGVIRARGADAASFLHSQLTQDIATLDEGQARLAGYCSAKGRLLATFIVWREGHEDILLACSADLLSATLKRLSMFVLRARCKLTDASAEIELSGMAGPSARAALATGFPDAIWQCRALGGGRALRLPDALGVPRLLFAAPTGAAAPALPALDLSAWSWLEVSSGVARVTAATAEQFVPQMLNLELLGGVNFQKGCYPGQEVVARSQYRGTLKRRTFLVDSSAALTPGQEVFHSADPAQPAGMVVLAASLRPQRHRALVELKIASLDGGELRSGDALLSPTELPYLLATEAA